MNWLKRLFGGEQAVIAIPNSYGQGDGSALLVEKSPDLEKIFNSPDPPVIQKRSDGTRDYWSTASVDTRRTALLVGYLQHPNPEVRKAVMAFTPPARYMPASVRAVLVDRLGGDPDALVRLAAAKTIWERERESNCKYAVSKLKDETKYGTGLSVGPSQARKALQLLIDNAPDQDAKRALQKLINQ